MGILVTAYWLKKATIFQLCPWFVVSYCTWLAINAIMYFHTTKHVVSLMLCLPFWVEFVWRYVPSSVCKQTSKNWNGDNHCCLRILHETFVKNFDLSGFVSYFADYLLHCRRPTILTFESVRICKAEKKIGYNSMHNHGGLFSRTNCCCISYWFFTPFFCCTSE